MKKDCPYTRVDIILTNKNGDRIVVNAIPEEISYTHSGRGNQKDSITIKMKNPTAKRY